MENERFDYIILDSVNASYASNWASWDVPDYMFKQYEKDDEIFISLHSCEYSAVVTNPSSSNSLILVDGLDLKNQESSNRSNLLSIRDSTLFERASTYYISSNNNNSHDMTLNVSKFYKIKLQVIYEGIEVDIENTQYAFILKVSYKKKS